MNRGGPLCQIWTATCCARRLIVEDHGGVRTPWRGNPALQPRESVSVCVCVHSNNNNNISNIIINQTFFFFHGCDLGGRRRLDRRILSCHSASFDSARVLLLSRCAVDYFQFFASLPPGLQDLSKRSPRGRGFEAGPSCAVPIN